VAVHCIEWMALSDSRMAQRRFATLWGFPRWQMVERLYLSHCSMGNVKGESKSQTHSLPNLTLAPQSQE